MSDKRGDVIAFLVRRGVASTAQLEEAQELSRQTGVPLGTCLIRLGHATLKRILKTLAEFYVLQTGSVGPLRSWMDVEWHRDAAEKVRRSDIHRLIVELGFPVIYTTNYDRVARILIEGQLATSLGIESLTATCEQPASADVGTTFGCTADLPSGDTVAVAEFIHSLHATMGGQGSPPGRNPTNVTLNVLVGDAKTGETAFTAVCGPCHSVTGNLKGIGSKFQDPRALQNGWVSGSTSQFAGARGGGGRGGGGGNLPAIVTLADGTKLEGTLVREDDFLIVLLLLLLAFQVPGIPGFGILDCGLRIGRISFFRLPAPDSRLFTSNFRLLCVFLPTLIAPHVGSEGDALAVG